MKLPNPSILLLVVLAGMSLTILSWLLVSLFDGKPETPPEKYSQELLVKAHLINEYNPGISFGMPRVISDYEMAVIVGNNPDLVGFVKEKFGITSDYDVYTKIMQVGQIALTKTQDGYEFEVRNGKSCTIFTHKGKVTVDGKNITHKNLQTTSKEVPC